MNNFRKISGLWLATMLTVSLPAQNIDCIIREGFNVSGGTSLHISNKYGDISIITVSNDSVSICATITIDQENKELVQRSINLINVRIGKTGDTISLSTSYNKKFFSPAYSQGRKSFSVNYTIKMPAYVNARITNAFGNVAIEELSGSLDLKMSQGFLTAKKLTRGNTIPINSIHIDHGKLSIDEINWSSLNLLNCTSVIIHNARALLISSDFSKISIGEISSIVYDSKSDSYNIESAKNIVSKSLYSTIEIGKLTGQMKSEATYGSVVVSDLKKEFSIIDIISSHTPITIITGDGVSFKSELTSKSGYVDVPEEDYPGINKTINNSTASFTGITGDDILTKSLIRISTTYGKLSIRKLTGDNQE